ncbi:MAG: NAD(P)H-hydrate epimerase, partial [Bacillota bacterium]
MKIVTADEMREIDRRAIEVVGIPGVVLMENAGRAVSETIKDLLWHLENPRVCIFAGKGNNGGDGFVIARHLANSGFRVKTFLLGEKGQVQGDAKINLDILQSMGMDVEELSRDGLPTA